MFFLNETYSSFAYFFPTTTTTTNLTKTHTQKKKKTREREKKKFPKKKIIIMIAARRAQGVGEMLRLRVHTPDGIARPHAMVRPCDATFFNAFSLSLSLSLSLSENFGNGSVSGLDY